MFNRKVLAICIVTLVWRPVAEVVAAATSQARHLPKPILKVSGAAPFQLAIRSKRL